MMDVEKVKKWIELTEQYQRSDHWKKIFNHYPPGQFFHGNRETPKVDIYQTETHIMIFIEIPGTQLNDFSISLKSETELLVKGIIRPPAPDSTIIKKERFTGNFERIIQLPEPAEGHLIRMTYDLGILEIIYPRNTSNSTFSHYNWQ
jgi:HSP20 family protein